MNGLKLPEALNNQLLSQFRSSPCKKPRSRDAKALCKINADLSQFCDGFFALHQFRNRFYTDLFCHPAYGHCLGDGRRIAKHIENDAAINFQELNLKTTNHVE